MEIVLIVTASFFATSVMTAFSYALANLFNEQFREPKLLELQLKHLIGQSRKSDLKILSWFLHYLIGLIMVAFYHYIWAPMFGTTFAVAVAFGTTAGAVGIIGWKTIFFFNKHELQSDKWQYYAQLFVAHLLFGISVFVIYNTLNF